MKRPSAEDAPDVSDDTVVSEVDTVVSVDDTGVSEDDAGVSGEDMTVTVSDDAVVDTVVSDDDSGVSEDDAGVSGEDMTGSDDTVVSGDDTVVSDDTIVSEVDPVISDDTVVSEEETAVSETPWAGGAWSSQIPRLQTLTSQGATKQLMTGQSASRTHSGLGRLPSSSTQDPLTHMSLGQGGIRQGMGSQSLSATHWGVSLALLVLPSGTAPKVLPNIPPLLLLVDVAKPLPVPPQQTSWSAAKATPLVCVVAIRSVASPLP